jgi:hypothetical protein
MTTEPGPPEQLKPEADTDQVAGAETGSLHANAAQFGSRSLDAIMLDVFEGRKPPEFEARDKALERR